jgi:WD40-like Beta Propeller Repeat
MNHRVRLKHRLNLRLLPLENRIVPTGPVSLVSHAAPGFYADGAGRSGNPTSMSADGRYTVYDNDGLNLVNGQVDSSATPDLFLFDRVANTTTLISHAAGSPTTTANEPTYYGSISADGRVVVFASGATNLVSGFAAGNGSSSNLYAYETLTGITALISHATGSINAGVNGDTPGGTVSADGRYITFSSQATNLIPGFTDGNGAANSDVFVFDRNTGATRLVSHSTASATIGGNGSTSGGSISADGRFITVNSGSTNLVTGYSGTGANAFVYDQVTDTMMLVSRKYGTTTKAANSGGSAVGISADGQIIVVSSRSSDIISGLVYPAGQGYNLFLCNVVTGTTQLITHAFNSSITTATPLVYSYSVSISDDGRYVLYSHNAGNLISGLVDNNNAALSGGDQMDLYVYDSLTNTSTLVDRKTGTTTQTANIGSIQARITADGRYIVFACDATDLVAGFIDGNAGADYNKLDQYLFDRVTGTVRLVSHVPNSMTTSGNGGSSSVGVLSGDGAYIAYSSWAANLASDANGINASSDVLLYDHVADSNSLMTRHATGLPSLSAGGAFASVPGERETSDDGRFAVYTSTAGNLVPGQIDTHNSGDIFLYDRATNSSVLVSHAAGAATTAANGVSTVPSISSNGRFVAYVSAATDLVSGFVDGNGVGTDIFLYDRTTGLNHLVSRQDGTVATGGNNGSGISAGIAGSENLAPVVSDNGRVAFSSDSTDLVNGFLAGGTYKGQLFAYDFLADSVTLVSHSAGLTTQGGMGDSFSPNISADGNIISFESVASDLVAGVSSGFNLKIYEYNSATAIVVLVSHAPGAPLSPGNWSNDFPILSRDGRYVIYYSISTNLVSGYSSGNTGAQNLDLYEYDRVTDTNILVSHTSGSANTGGNGKTSTYDYAISDDGRYVAYSSTSTDLVAGFVDGNGPSSSDLFLFDRVTGINTLVSHVASTTTLGGNYDSYAVETSPGKFLGLSGDGRFLIYVGFATNLVGGAIAGPDEIFLYDRVTGLNSPVDRPLSIPDRINNNPSTKPAISDDGKVVYFVSGYGDMVSGDLDYNFDVFSALNQPPRVSATTVADGSAQRSIERSLTVTIDQPVTFAGDPAAAFTLTRTGPGGSATVPVTATVVTGNSTVVTLTFSGPLTQFGSLVDGRYELKLAANHVIGTDALDGNNDGIAGDDYTFDFYRLFGDADGDGWVSASDFAQIRLSLFSANNIFDFDGDGYVSAYDFFQFRLRFNSGLP